MLATATVVLVQTSAGNPVDVAPWGIVAATLTALTSAVVWLFRRMGTGQLVDRSIRDLDDARAVERTTLEELVRQGHKREQEYLRMIRDLRK